MTQRTRHAPPKAGAMMEALRGLGYSTAAALADGVDNSISAGASEVRLRFDWEGQASRISILDDGRGMSDPELEAAMTLGTINPLESATGMKVEGGIMPSSGWFQRSRASKPMTSQPASSSNG